MENNTLTPYFKMLPLAQVWEGDFNYLSMAGMPPKQLRALKGICKVVPSNNKQIYDFLLEKDSLVSSIYIKSSYINRRERFIYPFVVNETIDKDVVEVVGPIGAQNSKYHHENIKQHACIVAVNLVKKGIDKPLAVKLAVLHDLGKKYTSATNAKGELCFYGHAELSAFITSYWLRRSINEQQAKEIVAIIYGHTFPFTSWKITKHPKTGERVDYKNDYHQQLLKFCDNNELSVKFILETIETLSECNEGIPELNNEVYKKVEIGDKLIYG